MRRDDSGFAMMATVMGVGAIAFLILTIFQTAQGEYREAQFQRRDDTVVVAAEGMLDRYAGKLTIDPLYYRHYVDEGCPAPAPTPRLPTTTASCSPATPGSTTARPGTTRIRPGSSSTRFSRETQRSTPTTSPGCSR